MTTARPSNDALQSAAIALVKSDSDAPTLQAVATILKYTSEAEKAQVETRNITRNASTEAFRFYVPVIAPLVSAMAIVGALVFQAIQFRETSRLQADTVKIQRQTVELQAKSAEDTAWREALKTLTQSPTVMSGVTGTTLLSAYLSSGSHVEEARSISLSLLGDLQFFNIFSPLFAAVMKATPENKALEVLADLSFRLREIYLRLDTAANDMRPRPNPALPTLIDQNGKDFPNPLFARDQVGRQLTLVCDTVVRTLKEVKQIPQSSQTLGLTLWDCDMSGVDFATLGLIGANIQGTSLVGADLGRVTEYQNSNWSNTAWWRAKRIEKELLRYLTRTYPFSTKGQYSGQETKTEYDLNLERLGSGK